MNINELNEWCKTGLEIAEHGIASEKLARNIVKEEFWKGEACAYRATLGMMQEDTPSQEQKAAQPVAGADITRGEEIHSDKECDYCSKFIPGCQLNNQCHFKGKKLYAARKSSTGEL